VDSPADVKPLLRGWPHLIGVILLLATSPVLLLRARSAAAWGWTLSYLVGVSAMMGVSALFHRVQWGRHARRIWKRLDHSMIFAAIAGSYVAIGGLTLRGTTRWVLLLVIGVGSVVGILIRQYAIDAPKWVNTLPYVVVGWAAAGVLPQLLQGGGGVFLTLVLVGGVSYTVGAVFYGTKRPRLNPRVFGYHELFHVCTLVGAGCHFAAIYLVLR
jgi:hemolysin III